MPLQGGTIKDSVEVTLKMPSQWLNPNIDNGKYYLAQGNREGGLIIKTVNSKAIRENSMNQILVIGDESNA